MKLKSNKGTWVFLSLFITGVFVMPFISSCSKSGAASSVGINTQIEVLNLGPDLQGVTLYGNYLRQGTNTFTYPNSLGYFYLNTLDTPQQIKSVNLAIATPFVSLDEKLASNHKYSLFITGLLSNSSITYIFTEDDTTAIPPIGYGKIRFVNASLPSTPLDVSANGTVAFPGVTFKTVTNYQKLPAGTYNFQINQTSTPAILLPNTSIQAVTIQDGRLYTLYTYGIIGRATTDTSAFGAQVLTNR